MDNRLADIETAQKQTDPHEYMPQPHIPRFVFAFRAVGSAAEFAAHTNSAARPTNYRRCCAQTMEWLRAAPPGVRTADFSIPETRIFEMIQISTTEPKSQHTDARRDDKRSAYKSHAPIESAGRVGNRTWPRLRID